MRGEVSNTPSVPHLLTPEQQREALEIIAGSLADHNRERVLEQWPDSLAARGFRLLEQLAMDEGVFV